MKTKMELAAGVRTRPGMDALATNQPSFVGNFVGNYPRVLFTFSQEERGKQSAGWPTH
jgi:hypothetical protein